MKIDILLSGSGGQGLMSLGKFLATSAIRENKLATYIPSYGAEVRGGTAYCFVRISDRKILSPLVENPDVAIILNQQSLDKFGKKLGRNCLLILNSDTIKNTQQLAVKKIINLPLNSMALECGNIKCANVVALGILLHENPGIIKKETIITILNEIFSNKELINSNIKALRKGESHGNC